MLVLTWRLARGSCTEQVIFAEEYARAGVPGRVNHIGIELAGPTILVTHDREDVEVLADEVIVLEAGRITQRGSLADLARNPATAWIARFTGAQGRRDADDVRYG